MSEEERAAREQLIARILERSVYPLATWKKPEYPPILGPKYLEKLSELEAKRKVIVDAVALTLSTQTTEDLENCYDERGDATDSEVRRIQADWQKSAKDILFRKRLWDTAGLGNPEFLTNASHWSAMSFFTLGEAVLLSSGLEPIEELVSLVSKKPQSEGAADPIYRFLRGRWELIRRQFDRNNQGQHIDPRSLLGWIDAESFNAHPNFVQMLRVMVARRDEPNAMQSKGMPTDLTGERRPDPRELAALSKLLLAIAITEYGYVPDAPRSPIPKQIQDTMDKLGLGMSEVTIRKYLQMGRAHLPKDWKPHD